VEFVRATRSPGSLYLVPPYWDDFRLASGAPTFVDWDFIPYEDVAVLEWHKRFRMADAFYRATAPDRCRLLQTVMAEYPITHVAVAERASAVCTNWRLVFQADDHRLYEVRR
jgi:hypothetical protein